ncbi:MAG: ATP-binding protein [Adlercreutzia equolifaciens]
MLRKIIHIDEDKCTGCGLCVDACHEGAIAMVDGKARLVRDDYCDGLGDCLPACPYRRHLLRRAEAAPYDEAAVAAPGRPQRRRDGGSVRPRPSYRSSCPGSAARTLIDDARSRRRRLRRADAPVPEPLPERRLGTGPHAGRPRRCSAAAGALSAVAAALPNRLAQWPRQIKLVPVRAPTTRAAGCLSPPTAPRLPAPASTSAS